MHSAATQSLACSFCRKPQSSVQKLIASPSESVRAYICDECIAVCNSIVQEDAPKASEPPTVEDGHPMLEHPLASEMLSALELWIKRDSLGLDAAEELAAIRSLASQMFSE